MNIYVGNLNHSSSEDAVREHFAPYGEVSSVRIIKDRDTGAPRGFAFVEMADDEAAKKAMAELDGKELDGRALRVNEARPKPGRR